MTTPPPATVGMSLEQVDTPALLLDLDAFEANLQKLADEARAAGIKLRPHAKTHKSPSVALRQMALGAVGSCCQKVSEAEAMVNGGVPDVYISNQVVGEVKYNRLAALATRARISTCVDDRVQAEGLNAAAGRFGVVLDVLVEVDVGAARCGVAPGAPVAELAALVAGLPHLRFGGLQAYQGAAQHKRTPEERGAAIAECVRRVQESQAALAAAGLDCPLVTGAGTGTYPLEIASGVYGELQAGSYAFMDADYAKNRDAAGGQALAFAHSLFVYTTLMSRTRDDQAIVDAGLKALSVDSGMPWVQNLEGGGQAGGTLAGGVEYLKASDEHGTLRLTSPQPHLQVGRKLMLIPGHCDPTINLYDWYVCIRKGRVEALWPISARGMLW